MRSSSSNFFSIHRWSCRNYYVFWNMVSSFIFFIPYLCTPQLINWLVSSLALSSSSISFVYDFIDFSYYKFLLNLLLTCLNLWILAILCLGTLTLFNLLLRRLEGEPPLPIKIAQFNNYIFHFNYLTFYVLVLYSLSLVSNNQKN